MKRTLVLTVAATLMLATSPAYASGPAVTKSGCIKIDREWLTVKRDLAGVDTVYKISEVAAALQHAAGVWNFQAAAVKSRGGSKVATALTSAAASSLQLRTKLLKADSKGALALSKSMATAMEKTVLPACAALF